MDFLRELARRTTERNTRICLGFDPRPAWHPKGLSLIDHCREILTACAPYVCAVKPQLAFFEALGEAGMASLFELARLARSLEIPVIFDAKRGDIGSTAEAYAQAYLLSYPGSAMTVHPYLGKDSLAPFVSAAKESGGAVFCLVRTSNPGADDLQALPVAKGTVAERVAAWLTELNGDAPGYGPLGAVVGATRPAELAHFRKLLPKSVLLLPGVGAQGGRPEDLSAAFHAGGLGAVVAASRSLEYASTGSDFAQRAEEAARILRDAVNAAI